MKKWIIGVLIFIATVSIGCFKKNDEQAVKNVIIGNIEAMNREDIKWYMSTIYDDGTDNYDSLEVMLTDIFAKFSIEIEILSIEIVEIGDDVAKARAKTSTKVDGNYPNKNSKATSVHYLVKDNGVWKIQSTINEEVKYFD
ncbi:MAG: hypothetical protein AB7T10_02070 [bacterium]